MYNVYIYMYIYIYIYICIYIYNVCIYIHDTYTSYHIISGMVGYHGKNHRINSGLISNVWNITIFNRQIHYFYGHFP